MEHETKLQEFVSQEFGGVLRTLEEGDKVWFVAKDVAEMLGYARPAEATKDHCKGTLKRRIPTNGGMQEMNVIPEGDVYRLVVHSKLPSAERFESWVFDEVLPTIRKTGSYNTRPKTQAEALLDTVKILVEQEKRLTKVEKELQDFKDTVVVRPNEWRTWVNDTFKMIGSTIGDYVTPRKRSYFLLSERAHIDLKTRLRHLKERASMNGLSKSKVDQVNYLDVVEQDAKAKEIYIAIVKEIAMSYGFTEGKTQASN